MEAITQTEPVVTVTDTETIEFSIDLPGVEEFVPCMNKCGHRSYMFFYFMDGLMSYCKHHGEINQKKLEELGGTLVLDTRDRLIENRLQGQL